MATEVRTMGGLFDRYKLPEKAQDLTDRKWSEAVERVMQAFNDDRIHDGYKPLPRGFFMRKFKGWEHDAIDRRHGDWLDSRRTGFGYSKAANCYWNKQKGK